MKKSLLALTVCTLSLITLADSALFSSAMAAEGRIRARGQNGVAAAGSNDGNAYVRARGARTNPDGSTTAASGGAFRTNDGAAGARKSTTTVNPDGSASHSGTFGVTGDKGTATSEGGFTRNADGTVSGARATDVTNAQTGNSYSGTASYNSTTGVTRSATCRDATGATIACPTR